VDEAGAGLDAANRASSTTVALGRAGVTVAAGACLGGLGLLLGFAGFVVLAYLTVVKLTGHAIGQRPLLLLGVLLVLVGVQLLMFGLLAELMVSRDRGNLPSLVRERSGNGSGPV
jgi:hypothetical protein